MAVRRAPFGLAPCVDPDGHRSTPPAYAKDDKVVCFFKPGAKYKERYCTFGFNTPAKLDDGGMWATSFAVTNLSRKDEARLAALVKKAVGQKKMDG